MSIFKFKNNLPKSITVSNISEFDISALDTPEIEDNNILGLDIEQADSDIDENEQGNEFLQSLNIQLPPQQIQDSKKLTNSRSLTMSKSRTKDELIPDNFTELSIQRLSMINDMLNLKDNVDVSIKQKIKNRLQKKISSLRIIKKNFSFNLALGIYNKYHFQNKDITSLNNQLFLKYDNFVKRYILDVDYFRCQDVCDNDQFQYLAISSYDQNKIVLSNNKQQLLIYDVDKAKKKSLTLSQGLSQEFCSLFQLEYDVRLIKNYQENMLLISSEKGLLNTFDNRTQKVTNLWLNYSLNEENNHIKHIDQQNDYTLLTYSHQWVIVDQRKPEKPLEQNSQPNLKKSMFMNQEKNILFFQEKSNELSVFNTILKKNLKQKVMQYNIVDVLNIGFTKELVVLQNNELEKNKWISQFTILDNYNQKMKEIDQTEFILIEPINNIQIDKTQELIYGINTHNVGVWRFNNNEEMNEIKSNLLKVAN